MDVPFNVDPITTSRSSSTIGIAPGIGVLVSSLPELHQGVLGPIACWNIIIDGRLLPIPRVLTDMATTGAIPNKGYLLPARRDKRLTFRFLHIGEFDKADQATLRDRFTVEDWYICISRWLSDGRKTNGASWKAYDKESYNRWNYEEAHGRLPRIPYQLGDGNRIRSEYYVMMR